MKKKKVSKVLVLAFLHIVWTLGVGFALPGYAAEIAPPNSPKVSLTIEENHVTLQWNEPLETLSYQLYFVCVDDLSTVESVKLGQVTELSFDLWEGAALYVAIQALNEEGGSRLTDENILFIAEEKETTPVENPDTTQPDTTQPDSISDPGDPADPLNDPMEVAPSEKRKWTVMVYIAGDNNLSSAAVGDINEMELVGSDEQMNVIVQAEFSESYSPNLAAEYLNTTLRGRIVQDYNTYKFKTPFIDIGNQDMGVKETLTDFITWSVKHYPAEHYVLVLWDHGTGWKQVRTQNWTKGALEDSTSDTFMSLPDMAEGIRAAGVKLDIIEFDACLMAMYEVAYEFLGLADYMTFSEEVEPGEGNPYDKILRALSRDPDMIPEDCAVMITDKFRESYQIRDRAKVTKSAVSMSKVAALHTEIQNFVAYIKDRMPDLRPHIQAARDASIAYEFPENHDLGGFFRNIIATSTDSDLILLAQNTYEALSAMVVSNKTFSPDESDKINDSEGVAIFLPKRDQVTNKDLEGYQLLAINKDTSRSGEETHLLNSWGEFVQLLVTGDTDSSEAPLEEMQTAEGNFVIRLEWDTDSDLDLMVWEADGSWAAPYIGATSNYGFLSEDSADSGVSQEYYAAMEEIEAGYYDIFVRYYADGSEDHATASVYLLDPVNGIDEFELIATRAMDLSFTAPEEWYNTEDDPYSTTDSEWDNVWDDLYTDWWWPKFLSRSRVKGSASQIITLDAQGKGPHSRLVRINFQSIPLKAKPKRLPGYNATEAIKIKDYFHRDEKRRTSR